MHLTKTSCMSRLRDDFMTLYCVHFWTPDQSVLAGFSVPLEFCYVKRCPPLSGTSHDYNRVMVANTRHDEESKWAPWIWYLGCARISYFWGVKYMSLIKWFEVVKKKNQFSVKIWNVNSAWYQDIGPFCITTLKDKLDADLALVEKC